MAQSLKTITIAAPGFWGINSQDSPIQQNPAFASAANNVVIDKYGRVGARKGFTYDTTDSSPLGSSEGIISLHQFIANDGTATVLSAGNDKIFSGTTTLTDETPGGATITASNWKIVSHNNLAYFFQSGHAPLYFDPSSGNVDLVSNHPSYSGTVQQGNEVLSAYGRLWVADISGNRSTVYWSDLLQGFVWDSGTAGSIDIHKHWPNGTDSIVALAEHNDRLIIFGERSILIFVGASEPWTMQIEDSITNVGCVDRDTVISIGNDLLFMAYDGLRSLSRTIEQRSNPLGTLSNNVRSNLIGYIEAEARPLKAVYSPEQSFYLVSFPTSSIVYCFDMRGQLEDGSHRVTTWSNLVPNCFERLQDGTLKFGMVDGISEYTGYNDNGTDAYQISYLSHPMDFGSPSNLKFLKKLVATLIGQQGSTAFIKWGYDYETVLKQQQVTLRSKAVSEFNVAEFNIGEFTTGIVLNTTRNNTDGSGLNISVGLEASIDGGALSIQKLDVQALTGRVY